MDVGLTRIEGHSGVARGRQNPAQFGSEPAMAVFTSGELAMARAIFKAAPSLPAPRHHQGDEFARAFAVACDGLRQLPHHRAGRLFHLGEFAGVGVHSGSAVGHQQQRVVGGCVAIHREAVVAGFHAALNMARKRATGTWASVMTKPSVVAICG